MPSTKKRSKEPKRHPPYIKMIFAAIVSNKHAGKGVSRQKIANFIKGNDDYQDVCTGAAFNNYLRKALERGIEKKLLSYGSTNQRYKLTDLGRKERNDEIDISNNSSANNKNKKNKKSKKLSKTKKKSKKTKKNEKLSKTKKSTKKVECDKCEKNTFESKMHICNDCDQRFCSKCFDKCPACKGYLCPECDELYECDGCKKELCDSCRVTCGFCELTTSDDENEEDECYWHEKCFDEISWKCYKCENLICDSWDEKIAKKCKKCNVGILCKDCQNSNSKKKRKSRKSKEYKYCSDCES